MKSNGWIRLHRKIMDGPDWLSEPFTRAQAWIDLLLLANHETGHIRKRGILIEVQRGQVGFSEEKLAARWRWSRGKVLRFFRQLIERSQISRNPVQQNPRLSSLITILNYDYYQSDDTTSGTTDGQQTDNKRYRNKKNKKNKKNPDEISSEISLLKQRYPDPKIIDRCLDAIRTTRKTGKASDSVILSILQSWEVYTVDQVEEGIRIYLSKDYAAEGKSERYLLGIIRNRDGQEPKGQGQLSGSTGSSLLDQATRENWRPAE